MSAPRRFELDRGEPGYPEVLEYTPNPPRRLYGYGDPTLLRPGLGVVGARRATPYGLSCTREFAGWAAARGVVIVSGAARGCDVAAHRAAMEVGGPIVAVLGCGADIDYPASSADVLAAARDGGAVVSEMPWGESPRRSTFVPRNRIIAGLSAALLVVEASLPSGTFTTADFALDAGRAVLAVPGSIRSPESMGSNRLIRQGARPITDVSELAAELRDVGLLGDPVEVPEQGPGSTADALLAAVLADPMRPDDLAHAMSEDVSVIARRLTDLELEGRVRRYNDGRFGP